ncbi:MAG: hypothetical protein ACLPVY_20295 [Acidimicrobiia bacterium]
MLTRSASVTAGRSRPRFQQYRYAYGPTPPQIVERLATIAPKTVRGRSRGPALVRHHAKLKVDGPVSETWKLDYLIDTAYRCDL